MNKRVNRPARKIQQKMPRITLILAALVITAAGMLSGCGQRQVEEWAPTGTTLVVNEDGTLTETIMDTLDRDYYSAQSLQQLVDQSVSEYNAENGADQITIDSCQIEGKQIELVMTYRSGAAYAAYNNVDFFNGSMLGAQMEGFRFESTFYEVRNGTSGAAVLDSDVPLSHKEAQVLVTDDSHAVRVPGKIMYVSTTAVTTDERTAEPAAKQVSTDEEGSKDSGRSYIYIIYAY